ncbi:MAG: AI-2E family transporter, partial [Acidobacteriota bacterium]|nr:AI-2E family transporter [Acidobacteriota bacterium]
MSDSPTERDAPGARGRVFRRADASNVPLRTILVTVFTVAGVYLAALILYRLRVLLMLMLAGCFVALILNPAVLALERWHFRRGWAVATVSLVALAAFVGLAFSFGYPLINGLTHLANTLPGYVHKAESGKGWLGHLLVRYHVESWVTKNSAKLVSLAQGLSKPALALGRGAVSVLLAALTVFTFVVLLLMEAPRARRWLLATASPEHAARAQRVGAEVSRSASGYALGNLLTSIAAGVVVFVTLLVMGVPFAFLWALWVALVDFLPTIGGALAGIPTVLFAFGHSWSAGLVTLIAFLAYTQLENHVLNPLVMSRTVRLNPLWVFIAVLVGAEVGAWVGGLFGGFIGVLMAIPAAATIHAMIRELRRVETVLSDANGS